MFRLWMLALSAAWKRAPRMNPVMILPILVLVGSLTGVAIAFVRPRHPAALPAAAAPERMKMAPPQPAPVVRLRLAPLPMIPSERAEPAMTPWVAVVIDNSIPARPQSGLNQACIVYELPTEALITRFVAMFCDAREAAADPIGPVRSLRAFMLDVAHDFGVTVAHSGTSQSAAAAVKAGAAPALNEFAQPLPFRRDVRRPMPHNLYASGPALRRHVSPAAAVPAPWRWGFGASARNPSGASPTVGAIEITYHPGYDVRYVYNQAARRYHRFQAGRLAIDAGTREAIAPRTIIVQYARWWQVFEGPVLTSHIDLVGLGRLIVFSDGRRTEGRWRRDGARAHTRFTDLRGRPILVPAGPVWVQVVPLGHAVQSTNPRTPR